MVLGALDGVEEAVPVVGDALQHVVDPAGRDVASIKCRHHAQTQVITG